MFSPAPRDLVERIRDGQRFLLTSHIHPDGDAIASGVALARLLRSQGKGATLWYRDTPPKIYRAVPGVDRIHLGEAPPAGFPKSFDALIVLECPSPERSGLEEQFGKLPLLNIDHHLGNQYYGSVNWVEPSAPSVGEMVYRLARTMKLAIDEQTANALFLTLVTDTGGFRFSNATAAAFEAAADLVRDGAQPPLVSKWVYESQPEGMMRLLAEMLQTLELHASDRIALVRLEPEMFERAGAEAGDAEGLIDFPRSIAGVDAVALIRRRGEGEYKISLRSRGTIDVEKIARRHDGGGHHNAAGLVIEASFDEVRRTLLDELTSALEASGAGEEE
ncbi:MAG: bifunctional oligoribonuclease/PAP phosphatase NrnA [Acidobacteriota bacterium]